MNSDSVLSGLAALSNKSRWEIFWLLTEGCEHGKCAGDIGEQLGIAPATLSFHLKELTHVGLLQSTRSGRQIIYTSDCERIDEIVSYVQDRCKGCAQPRSDSPEARLSQLRGAHNSMSLP